jgi:hypothetical protein
MADCRAIAKFKQQKGLALKPKLDPDLCYLFEEISTLKRQLKPENTARRRGRLTLPSLLSNEINLATSSNEGEDTQ